MPGYSNKKILGDTANPFLRCVGRVGLVLTMEECIGGELGARAAFKEFGVRKRSLEGPGQRRGWHSLFEPERRNPKENAIGQ